MSDPALGFVGMFNKADELLSSIPNSYMLNQLSNPLNIQAHYLTTGASFRRLLNPLFYCFEDLVICFT
jgi:cysteine synthase A